MNEIIISILKIYITASIVYFIYLIYLKITKSKTVDDLINEYNEQTMINEYKKMKKKRIIVIILGILLGIAILILTENNSLDNIDNINNINKKINSKIVSDISDINVI